MLLGIGFGIAPALLASRSLNETLRSMGRSDSERLSPPVAREVCQRLGLKAMLDGSIATLGTSYDRSTGV